MTWTILQADARDIPLRDESVQCVVTDPPYGLKFMGKSWDHGVPGVDYWLEVMRVCKPGAYLLAFGSTRTFHRLWCAIEDAGWELRDSLCWLYGQGFPKNLNVSKAIQRSFDGDALCSCVPRSTQTVVDSESRCDDEHGFDGALLQLVASSDPVSSPSQGDVLERSHGGHKRDDRASVREHNPGRLKNDRLASDGFSRPSKAESDSLSADNKRRDKASSKSSALYSESRKTDSGKLYKQDSAVDSVSSSWSENANISQCKECGKVKIAEGLGTALKPAVEFICLARKPIQGTVADNVQKWGAGALNIDACRIGYDCTIRPMGKLTSKGLPGGGFGAPERIGNRPIVGDGGSISGRWPANVILDEEAAAMLDQQSGVLLSNSGKTFNRSADKFKHSFAKFKGRKSEDGFYGDSGGASRFFYTAKASRSDRGEGNDHPTVKPQDLIEYLIKLVSRPGDIVLDPFAGSGTTPLVADKMGRIGIGLDNDPKSSRMAYRRCYQDAPLLAQG